jgi:hypothetical protein
MDKRRKERKKDERYGEKEAEKKIHVVVLWAGHTMINVHFVI